MARDFDELLELIIEASEETDSPKTWKVIPTRKVGPIQIGANRASVYSALGQPKNAFKKSKNSGNNTDNYGYCHVYYDQNDAVEAVEVFPEITLMLGGNQLSPGTLNDAAGPLSIDIKEKGSYLDSKKSIGISFNVETQQVESILCARSGYYSEAVLFESTEQDSIIDYKETIKSKMKEANNAIKKKDYNSALDSLEIALKAAKDLESNLSSLLKDAKWYERRKVAPVCKALSIILDAVGSFSMGASLEKLLPDITAKQAPSKETLKSSYKDLGIGAAAMAADSLIVNKKGIEIELKLCCKRAIKGIEKKIDEVKKLQNKG